MRKLQLVISLVFLVLLLPATAPGQDYKNYLVGKAGVFRPSGDLHKGIDLRQGNFDAGFNGELALGRHLHPNFALEAGVGYFSTSKEEYYYGREEFDVSAVPLWLTAKGVLSAENVNFYVGGGFRIYFANMGLEGTDSTTGFSISDDDGDVVFGAHLVAGADFDITDKVFIGVEGKYIATQDAEFSPFGIPIESDLDGYTMAAKLGARF